MANFTINLHVMSRLGAQKNETKCKEGMQPQ